MFRQFKQATDYLLYLSTKDSGVIQHLVHQSVSRDIKDFQGGQIRQSPLSDVVENVVANIKGFEVLGPFRDFPGNDQIGSQMEFYIHLWFFYLRWP